MEEKNYKSRGEMVGETLKQEILDLRLKPGQMISENDVCDRFGVSRTPVRDVYKRQDLPLPRDDHDRLLAGPPWNFPQ